MNNLKSNESALGFEQILARHQKKIQILINQFNLCEYETDIMLKLWSLSKNINFSKFNTQAEIDNYIYICLKNHCISLYNKEKKTNFFIHFTDSIIDNFSTLDDYSNLEFNELISELNERQKLILILKFKFCFSDIEIANKLSISRQAVNKNIRLSINKLKSLSVI